MRAKSMQRSVPDFDPEVKKMIGESHNRRGCVPLVLVVVMVILACMAIAGFRDDAVLMEQQQYCRMVHDWKQSGGEVGWPDYDNAYDTSCNADGSVKEQP